MHNIIFSIVQSNKAVYIAYCYILFCTEQCITVILHSVFFLNIVQGNTTPLYCIWIIFFILQDNSKLLYCILIYSILQRALQHRYIAQFYILYWAGQYNTIKINSDIIDIVEGNTTLIYCIVIYFILQRAIQLSYIAQ